MSQHNILSATRKKLTYLAVALSLAAASPLAVPGLATASDKPDDVDTGYESTTTGYDEDGYRAFPDKKDWSGYAAYSDSGDDSTYKDKSWDEEKDYQDYSKDDYGYDEEKDYSDHKEYGYGGDKDYSHEKDYSYDKPDKDYKHYKKREPKVVEKTVVVHQPAEVSQEVNQEVKQETNVVVEQREKEVVRPQPVVHERRVVHEQKPVVMTATTTRAEPETTVIGEGDKGVLEETGSQAATSTATGLGILGALGALHILRRRKTSSASQFQQ